MSFVLDEEKTWVQRDFGLDRRLCKALAKLGYVYPTLVQAKALPIALQGKDLLVRARTGSGKTVAFGLPLLHKLLTAKENNGNQKFVFGVVLAPTKELCKQIEKNLTDLIYYCKDIVSVVSIVDENPAAVQYRLQNKPDIIVSTPSKLIQQIQSGKVDLSQAKTLVIDEADLVLSFGYADEVQAITAKMPKIFQGLFMSATLSPELDKFKRVVLHNPAILKLEESKSVGNLLQFYLPVSDRDKFLVLYVFLKLGLLQGKGLIFVNDIDRCYRLKLFLQQFYVSSAVLNSEMPLNSRLHIIDEFNRGVFDYLIATDASIDNGNDDESDDDEDDDKVENAKEEMSDNNEDDNDDDNDGNEDEDDDEDNDEDNEGEDNDDEDDEDGEREKAVKMEAANPNDFVNNTNNTNKPKSKKRRSDAISGYGVSRGLDFQGVSFVINFDFPVTSSAYTHRIGRTARGGATGTALSLVAVPGPNPKEYDYQIAERDQQVLREVRSQQPRLGNVEGDNLLAVMGSVNTNDAAAVMDDENTMQPSPLVFNMEELDTFRYRCEDTLRSVTGAAVKELRAAELKREILNSNKLKSYFSENPNDFKVLRHDCSVSHPIRPKEHLKHIPDYLVPQSMRGIANNSSGQKKKKRRKVGGDSQNKIQQSKMRDPLLNPEQYQGQQSQPSHDDGDDDNDDQPNKRQKRERIYTDGELKHSKTISGRKEWKIRHKKGEYNPKIAKKLATGNHVKGSFQRRKK